MIAVRLKWIIALLLGVSLVIVAQASLQGVTYIPLVNNSEATLTPTATNTLPIASSPANTSTSTPTRTLTPSPTATETPTPTPTITGGPYPMPEVNSLFEIELIGPASIGMGAPNPFLIDVQVTFTGPLGKNYVVPGFYDGDGGGGMDGSIWKARFTPDKAGVWTYVSTSQELSLNGYSGAFIAVDPSGCAGYEYTAGGLPDFSCLGRLKYTNSHYLGFASGQYWFKGGVNDPEDFLLPGNTVGFPTKEDAIDFLAANGANSLYMLLNNLGGDGSNLYPWVGDNPIIAMDNDERFDLAKLAAWEQVFNYLQSNGIVLHLVFEDDSGWTGFNRSLYYREMIARFGHYNGLMWNVAEEFNENYTTNQVKNFAQLISDLDAYDHPLTVHQQGLLTEWEPLLGDVNFDATSFQHPLVPIEVHNPNAVDWFGKVEDSGRLILVAFDEIRYFSTFQVSDSRHVIWAVYMGGANYELRTQPDTDYLPFEQHIDDMHTAREFMEQLPYWQMEPRNDLLVSGTAYVFSKPGAVYSVYLPDGGQIRLNLSGTSATFKGDWFNPRNGDFQNIGNISGSGIRTFNAPNIEDWVLLLR